MPPPRTRLVPAQTYVWNDAPALLEKDDWDPEEFRTNMRRWLEEEEEEFAAINVERDKES